MKTQTRREVALEPAEEIMRRLKPYCDKIEFAGSLRRKCAVVGDVEIVAQPKPERPPLVFGGRPHLTYFDAELEVLVNTGVLLPQNNGTKYMKFRMLPSYIQLDLFVVRPPAQWGVIFAIRTGPADFSHWIVTQKRGGGPLPDDLRVEDGAVWGSAGFIPTPNESDFLKLCGLDYIKPEKRQPRWGAVLAGDQGA